MSEINGGIAEQYYFRSLKHELLDAQQERELAIAMKIGVETISNLVSVHGIEEPELSALPPQKDLVEILPDPEVVSEEDTAVIDAAYEAKDLFINSNLRLVVNVAKRYQNKGLPLLDLIQEGNQGLMTAVDKFDHEKGFRFSTYAMRWIQQSIGRALHDKSRMIRLPAYVGEQLDSIDRLEQDYSRRRNGMKPGDDHLADMLDTSIEKIKEIQRHGSNTEPLSLQTKVGEDSEGELGDFLPVTGFEDEAVDKLSQKEIVRSLLGKLNSTELDVIDMRFGLSTGVPLTRDEVAARIGVSGPYISKVEARALRFMRSSA